MSRTKKSIFNAISMVLNTLLLSITSLITTRLIILNYGSDFNGVIATANQLVNLLLIVEGGFTLAINVALFKPFMEKDNYKMSSIIVAARNVFVKISFAFFALGLLASIMYPLLIQSELDYIIIAVVFMLVVMSTSFNMLFVVVPKIMFQVSQTEYVCTIFSTIVNFCSGIVTIVLVLNNFNMLAVRFSIFLFTIINGIIIVILYKKYFKNIDSSVSGSFDSIKGTKEVIIQRLTSVIYLSSPILFISTFASTMSASVYAVYLSVFNIIKMVLNSILAAPVNGFGQMLSTEDKEKVYAKYSIYEFIILFACTILLATTLSLIIPFVNIYTEGVYDINYIDYRLAILMCLIAFLEIVHIPAGNIINVSGNFKKSRDIQLTTAVLLLFFLPIGGYTLGIYGILLATIAVNMILASLEIAFVYREVFAVSLKQVVFKIFANLTLLLVCFAFWYHNIWKIDSYVSFFVSGGIVFVVNSLVILGINYMFNMELFAGVLSILNGKLLKRK